MKIIKKEDFKTTNWSGGTTSELFISPSLALVSEKNFDYRISSATCDLEKSIFTPYDAYTRYICPLDGALILNNEGEEIFLKPYEVYKFDGADKVSGHSKVRDFNFIINKNIEGKMYDLDIDGSLSITNASEFMLVFNFEYDFRAENKEFQKFSALLIEKTEMVKIEGKGKLLVCEI